MLSEVNALAALDANGVCGQTPIFHAVTQFWDYGLPVAKLLIDRGARLDLRVKLPGQPDRPGETVDCTPLGYARLFPGDNAGKVWPEENGCIALLKEHNAEEGSAPFS